MARTEGFTPKVGMGRSLLARDVAEEERKEREIYEKELKAAEDAAKEASEGKSLWTAIGSALGAAVGFWTGGFKGAVKGYTLGGEAGKWGHRGVGALTGTAYDPADYALSTDVGKFHVSQKYDIQDVNREFQQAADTEFWRDVTGTGTSLAALAFLPEGAEKGKTGKEMFSGWMAGRTAPVGSVSGASATGGSPWWERFDPRKLFAEKQSLTEDAVDAYQKERERKLLEGTYRK